MSEVTSGARSRGKLLTATVGKWKVALATLLVTLAFALGVRVGRVGEDDEGGGVDGGQPLASSERSEGIWTCSMHPQVRSDEPGQCPICGMDLVPVEGGSGSGGQDVAANRVTLTPRALALAKIRTAQVRRVEAEPVEVRLLGRLDYDERRLRTVTSWTEGRIDRLHVAVTGQRVARGQVIATLYSPEIYSAQGDLIQAARQVKRLSGGTPAAQVAAKAALSATRQRLRLLGVPERELTKMENAERPFRHVPLRADHGGTVIERLVDEGAYVNPGTGIYRVADLSRLWVQLDAYERDLALLARGQLVRLTVSAFPGETFDGRVAFIDPVLSSRTRTTRVRVEVDNPDGRLQPGMFAEASVEGSEGGDDGEGGLLAIPETAPLFTGRRSVVYVEVPDTAQPTYEARQVRLGHKTGDVYPVIAGLREGESVVVNGAFSLDADLQIRGGNSMMTGAYDQEEVALDRVVAADRGLLTTLEPVVGAYLNLQERLAEDDYEAAKGAARAVEREVEGVETPRSTEARTAWQDIAEELRGHAARAAAANDISSARVAFEAISLQIKELLQRFGNPLSAPLRLAFCPMAFENRGAEWVQRGEAIDNSYFGASMRRCGSIRATVQPGEHLLDRDEAVARGRTASGHQEHRH